MAGDFDWDDGNLRHIARHEVSPDEVEQVLENDPFDLDREYAEGEWRYPSVGVTNAGRWLFVAATLRKGKVRPVTAFDAPKRMVALYLRRKGRMN